jgi:hypothetical protein
MENEMPLTKQDLREVGEVLRHKLQAGRVVSDISGELNQWFDEVKTLGVVDGSLLQLWDQFNSSETTPGEKLQLMDKIIKQL